MTRYVFGAGSAPITHQDVDLMCDELFMSFRAKVEVQVLYANGYVQVIGVGEQVEVDGQPTERRQALRKVPLTSRKPLENLLYEVLWDIYMQFDRVIHTVTILPPDASAPRGGPRKR